MKSGQNKYYRLSIKRNYNDIEDQMGKIACLQPQHDGGIRPKKKKEGNNGRRHFSELQGRWAR